MNDKSNKVRISILGRLSFSWIVISLCLALQPAFAAPTTSATAISAATHWYRVRIELIGDELRVCLDDLPVAYLKSSGIDHAMKREFYFAVAGPSAQFDYLRIPQAQPAK